MTDGRNGGTLDVSRACLISVSLSVIDKIFEHYRESVRMGENDEKGG
jgi:hypothetical protein